MATTSSYTIAIPTLPNMSTYATVPMPLPRSNSAPSHHRVSQMTRSPSRASTVRRQSPTELVTLPSVSKLLDAAASGSASRQREPSPVLETAMGQAGDFLVKTHGVFEMRTKPRRKTSPQELAALEKSYEKNPLPSMADRMALSRELEMPARSIQIWFQNRRQTDKKKAGPPPAPPASTQPSGAWRDDKYWQSERDAALALASSAKRNELPRRASEDRPQYLHRSHSGSLEQLLQARERSFGTTSSSIPRRTQQRFFGAESSDRETMLDLMESDPPSMGLEELQNSSDMETESGTESDKSVPTSRSAPKVRTLSGRDERRNLGHPYRANTSVMQRRTASLDRVATSLPKPVRFFAPVQAPAPTIDSVPTTPVFSRSPSVASSGEMMVATPEVVQPAEPVTAGKESAEDEEAMRAAGALLALWGA